MMIRDELFVHIEEARRIIAGLAAFREFALTKAVSAEEINVILSEHTDIDNGPFVAVQIAEHIDAKLQAFDLDSPYPDNS